MKVSSGYSGVSVLTGCCAGRGNYERCAKGYQSASME